METRDNPHFENAENRLELFPLLKSLKRKSKIRGMEGVSVEDPVARDLIRTGEESLRAVEKFLRDNEITEVKALKSGHGFSAIVLDAGGGKVIRLSRIPPTKKPDVPHVLQPLVAARIGDVFVQISEKVSTENITEEDVEKVQKDLEALGYEWDDAGTDNLGRDDKGSLWIIDGSVKKRSSSESIK